MLMTLKVTLISTISFFIIILLSPAHDLQAQEYLICPDDVIKIEVYREDELNRKVRVSSDGYISLPLIGRVKAAGRSASGLETLLEKMYGTYLKRPHVTIFIEEYSTITISGQVKKPGSYQITGNLTVLEAISLAGGFTDIASRNNVRILRHENGKEKTIRVRVGDISKGDDKEKDIRLEPGDIVIVPESLF
jgi:protein involved in polysaccharide export with SLBB domain